MQASSIVWQPIPSSRPAELSPLQWEWLRYPASLTQKFADLFGDAARFCLQREGEAPLMACEQALMGAAASHWVRRSAWVFGDTPWLAARVVVPMPAEHPALLALATKPIGHILFKDPTCQRVASYFARLSPESAEYQAIDEASSCATACWARRTLFCYGADRIVISEIFFPAFFAAMAERGLVCP